LSIYVDSLKAVGIPHQHRGLVHLFFDGFTQPISPRLVLLFLMAIENADLAARL
jgi:hypothetical protein